MLFGKYTFRCHFESEAQLPEYKGSTLRGVFGLALKQVVCALKRQQCPSCLLKYECLYPMVFEPLHGSPNSRGEPPPHPFVLQPPMSLQTHYAKGDRLDFNLLLFGPVNQRLAYLIYAFDRMGRIGIGKKIEGKRAGFCLASVSCAGKEIYSGVDRKLVELSPAWDLKLNPTKDRPPACRRLTLRFETPLRIKHRNRLSDGLPFHVLVRAMLRRSSSLLAAYNGGEPALDYAGLVQRARSVRTTASTLAWEDWRRYSTRQDRAMLMGGLKGSITYEGDLSAYLPLTEFCAQVHIGKQTTFGLGRFTVEASA